MCIKIEVEKQIKDKRLCIIDMSKAEHAFAVSKGERRKDDTIFLGLEWEVEMEGRSSYYDSDLDFEKFLVKKLKSPVSKFVNFRSDGDLVEMVTIPATLKAHKNYMNKHLFKPDLIKKIEKHSECDEVGIHIHVSKKAFNKESLTRFIAFIRGPQTQDFMKEIADRPLYFEGDDYGDMATACKPIRINDNLVDSLNPDKYEAVNTGTHRDTVEVRIFNSSQSKRKVYAKLEFIDALVRYTRNPKNTLFAKDFSCFVKKNMVNYPNLVREACIKKNLNHRLS